DPWYDLRYDLTFDGHQLVSEGFFVVKVSSPMGPGDRVRVRVVLSAMRAEQQGIQISALNSSGSDTLMTTEDHHAPNGTNDLSTAVGNLPNPAGIWLRTFAGKATLDPSVGPDNTPNFGGYRSFWLTTWVSSTNTVELHFTSTMSSPADKINVSALEFYP